MGIAPTQTSYCGWGGQSLAAILLLCQADPQSQGVCDAWIGWGLKNNSSSSSIPKDQHSRKCADVCIWRSVYQTLFPALALFPMHKSILARLRF